jgi:hypothetical protein
MMYFDKPGKPVIFSVDNPASFNVTLVLATLEDSNSPPSSAAASQHAVQQSRASQRVTKQQEQQPITNHGDGAEETLNAAELEAMDEDWDAEETSHVPSVHDANINPADMEQDDDGSRSPVFAYLGQPTDKVRPDGSAPRPGYQSLITNDSQPSDDSNEFVPGTPPSKKFKSILLGMSTEVDSRAIDDAEVLAEDSQEED